MVLPRSGRDLAGADEGEGHASGIPTPPMPGGNATASKKGPSANGTPIVGRRTLGGGSAAQGQGWALGAEAGAGGAGAHQGQGQTQGGGGKGKRKGAARVSDDFYHFQSKDARRNGEQPVPPSPHGARRPCGWVLILPAEMVSSLSLLPPMGRAGLVVG